ncbi:helix-turn-helix domain-containing protein [Kitasatospora indigofera]|uniref:helix-turn-helix domain-containing protein n=1 Tax=Kitasatospora indigofera TaxID=67307 RepID=UPI0033A932AF
MNRKDLDPSSSPHAAFGVQLRRFRESRGLTQSKLGKLMGYSGAYVSAVERAERPPMRAFAVLADTALETGGTLELMWRSLLHSTLIEGFPEYTDREADATAIRLFEINVIPGLLQTAEYAAAYEYATVRRGSATQEQADERLDFLAVRQRLLARTSSIHAVLDESCLRRPIGGTRIMVGQLQHLEDLAQRPNVILQISPYELGEERPLSHPVNLLTLPNRTMLGYTETLQRGYLERDVEAVARWAGDYDRLQVEALPQAASLALIRTVRKEFENHAT